MLSNQREASAPKVNFVHGHRRPRLYRVFYVIDLKILGQLCSSNILGGLGADSPHKILPEVVSCFFNSNFYWNWNFVFELAKKQRFDEGEPLSLIY